MSPTVFSSLDRLRATIGGLGTQIAAVFGGYQLIHTALGALSDADDIGKFAQEVGIAVDRLSKLKYAADLAGAGDTFRTAMLKFTGVLAEAQIDGSKAAQMFSAMGVAVKDAAGKAREGDQVIRDVADRFSQWEDGAKKAAWSADLFGTRNARMTVLLNGSAEGLRKMGEEAERLHQVITPEIAKRAEEFNDAWENGKKLLKALTLEIASEVVPTFTELINKTSEATTGSKEWAEALETVKIAARGVAAATVLVSTGIAQSIQHLSAFARVVNTLGHSPWLGMASSLMNATPVGRLLPGPILQAAGTALLPKHRQVGTLEALREVGKEIGEFSEASLNRWQTALDISKKLLSTDAAEVITGKPGTVSSSGGKETPPDVPGGSKVGSETGTADVPKVDLAQERSALAIALDQLDVERERLRVSFSMPSYAKRAEEIRLLEREKNVLTDTVAELERKAALETDETRRATYTREILRVQDQQRDIERRRVNIEGTPDPYSLGDQMMTSITALREQFGTEAQIIARGFTHTIGSAVDSLQQGFRGLIDGTKNWGEALNSIRMGIVNGMIDAISRMFAEWVVGRALAGMAHIAWSIKEGVATKAALAPGALMASVSSYGAAAVIGAGALAAALAAMGTFREGGFTGDGPSGSVAGLVHRGEFVVPADVTSAWGVDRLEAIRSGALTPGDMERSQIAPVVNNTIETPNVSVIWARTENEVRDIVESELFKGSVVKVVRNRRTEAGIG